MWDIPIFEEDGSLKGNGHTSISYLKQCAGYEQAKNGDIDAARSVVQQCVKKERIADLRRRFPGSVLLPVLGRNQLPLALAQEIELPIWKEVQRTDRTPRKLLRAIQRLLHKPKFTGYIEKNTDYIIIDDIITQGGTVSSLREFVRTQGGKISAVVALAYAIGSHDITPTRENLFRYFFKFGEEVFILNDRGVAYRYEELTNSQVRYLLKFSSTKNIHNKIAKEREAKY